MGRRISELGIIGGDDAHRESAGREIKRTLASDGDWAGELWTRHRAGKEFPVHATVSPIRGRHTVPVVVVAISNDITDRKHSAAILRRFSAMVESSGDAIISADMSGTITSWNAGAARMFGWSPREAVGQNYRLLTTREGAGFDAEVRASIGSGRFVTGVEARWGCKNGSVIDVELTVSPVYGPDGDQVGASAIARDITEIQRLRAAAAGEREKLLAAQEMPTSGVWSTHWSRAMPGIRRSLPGSSAWWRGRRPPGT